jgi:hypothetical protein
MRHLNLLTSGTYVLFVAACFQFADRTVSVATPPTRIRDPFFAHDLCELLYREECGICKKFGGSALEQ